MGKVGKLIPFPEYAPDVTPLGSADSQIIFNVVPRADGYGPVQDMTAYSQALPGVCRGYFFARRTDGSISVFAGTATDLYLLNNTNGTWTRVSKGGVSYTQLPLTDNWTFVQFNDLVIACQVNTVPQKYTLTPNTGFVDLGGSPPQAGFVSVIGFFVVLTALQSNQIRAFWSDLDAPETWSAGVGLADFQDFPDGGSCVACSGGDAYGLIFQEQSMRSMTYAAGNPAIFQFYRISTLEALYAKYSVIQIGNRVFYLGAAGFKMVTGNDDPVDIGKEKVDRTFFADVDPSSLQLIVGSSAPQSTRVYFVYRSNSGGAPAGTFDRIMVFDYMLNKWTRVNLIGTYLASLAKPGLTLEQMDALAPQPLLVVSPGVSAGAGGTIRLTLTATSNSYFNISGQNFITVYNVVGTGGLTAAVNGVWKPNIIDSTHIDLVGTVWNASYVWTSGGQVGGSLDAMTFSLDTIAKSAIAQLSIFDDNNVLSFLSGPNLEAQCETGDADGEGNFLFTDVVMPITDATQVYCSVGWRNAPQAPPSYTHESMIDDQGQSPIGGIESRYQRGHVRIAYGTNWTYLRGIETDTQLAGER